MEKTPVSRSRLIRKQNNLIIEGNVKRNENWTSASDSFCQDESPVQIACTQEGCENVDVIWDWNSPQAKIRPKKSQKRLILSQSPKIPIKRYPSNNSIQGFEKLQEELRLLRNEIARPENEDSLRLSPIEEAEYKNTSDCNKALNSLFQENGLTQGNFEDLFDDSVDEKLILFSQQIEDASAYKNQLISDDIHTTNDKKTKEMDVEKIAFKNFCKNDKIAKTANDSFEEMLNKVENEKVSNIVNDNKEYCVVNKDTSTLFRTVSENITSDTNSRKVNICHMKSFEMANLDHNAETIALLKLSEIEKKRKEALKKLESKRILDNHNYTSTGKVEFHRTESFEMSSEEYLNMIPPSKLEEIERKRIEAMTKLESKRKHELVSSPTTCSSEEIERKRVQALIKREAKRQQEIIERKRQEALKRLEMNRKKNATIVKSTLKNRLNY